MTDLEERARHLSLAAGDEVHAGLAAQLEEAGRPPRAVARRRQPRSCWSSPLATARPRSAAIACTPRPAFTMSRVTSGAPCRSTSSLLEDLPAGPRRAAVLYAIGRVNLADAPERLASCERGLEEVGDDDALAAHILSLIGITCWLLGESAKGLAAARDGLKRAERVGDPPLVAMALATVGGLETWMLDVTRVSSSAAPTSSRASTTSWCSTTARRSTSGCSATSMATSTARAACSVTVVESAERRGDEHTRGFGLVTLIEVDREAGRIAAALRHADSARAIVEQMGDPQLLLMHAFLTTAALIDTGRLAEARALAAEGLAAARAMSNWAGVAFIQGRLGRAALVGGTGCRLGASGGTAPDPRPAGTSAPHRPDVGRHRRNVIALARLDEAAALLAQFDDLAARSSRWARRRRRTLPRPAGAGARGRRRRRRGDATGRSRRRAARTRSSGAGS